MAPEYRQGLEERLERITVEHLFGFSLRRFKNLALIEACHLASRRSLTGFRICACTATSSNAVRRKAMTLAVGGQVHARQRSRSKIPR
jgi:hypothetical protein